jgi:hypothetical protein
MPTCRDRTVGVIADDRLMYPRDTVELARLLSCLEILDRENAAICGVSIAAVRHWRRGSRRMPERRPQTLIIRTARQEDHLATQGNPLVSTHTAKSGQKGERPVPGDWGRAAGTVRVTRGRPGGGPRRRCSRLARACSLTWGSARKALPRPPLSSRWDVWHIRPRRRSARRWLCYRRRKCYLRYPQGTSSGAY